jgi:hypothetical protein
MRSSSFGRKRTLPAFVAGLVALALASCNPDMVVATGPVCVEGTRIYVGSGTKPLIYWTPNCRTFEVYVEPLADSASPFVVTAWGKQSWHGAITSPVRVGIDSTFILGPEHVELTVGERYQACMLDAFVKAGWRYLTCTEFTP